ncbi:uncharacterized protein LOC116143372 isoform X3 [Pistacia vera]|uniref:uncharacterized protein LOC116143372 isoform X3 n=1 Tax=Pistacia vera TaxID=55513 RepID=UPI0012630FE1|nr:uncharacterized protein LOC116143372 isoform X3 [Pistacia vera]
MVKTICEQCGDRGFSVALIYCDECQIAAVHRYCLAVMPEDFEEERIWYCVDCEKKVAKLSSQDNLNSLLARNCDSRNLEIVQETQSKKNDINRLKKKKQLKRRDGIDSLAKAEVCQGEISPCSHLELHCNENHEKNKDQKFRRQRELGGSSSSEEAESVKTKHSVAAIGDSKNNLEHSSELHCSEGDENNEKLERQIELDGSSSSEEAEPVKTKPSVTAIGDSKNNLEHSSELHCSEGDKNNEKLERQIELDGSSSDKEIVIVKDKTSPVVTNDPTDILQHRCYDHKRPIIKVHYSENDKGDNNFKRQKVLVRDGTDEEMESVELKSSLVATSISLNIPTQSSNARADSTTKVYCNQNDENAQSGRQNGIEQGSPNEEAESAKHETSLVVTSVFSNINYSIYVPAQPIFQPIWNVIDSGSLYLSNEKYGTVGGLAAHLSTMASSRVFEEAKRFPELLCLELLPRSAVWPNNFIKRGPSDDNIALYLFPNNDWDGKVYNSLVDDMVSHNLAMRSVLENAELLVFTSNVLPFQFWRFELKFYLWGVFRGKQASRVHATKFPHAITWYTQSPVSPLSHSEKNGINRVEKLQSIDGIGSLAKAEVYQGEISSFGQVEPLFSNSLQVVLKCGEFILLNLGFIKPKH